MPRLSGSHRQLLLFFGAVLAPAILLVASAVREQRRGEVLARQMAAESRAQSAWQIANQLRLTLEQIRLDATAGPAHWNGDETRVAYMDGSATTKLLDQPYPIWDYIGRWSPDGQTFYLISSRCGDWGLYAHDAASGSTRELWAEANGSANVPEFSADGRIIAFPVMRATRQLWAMELTR